MKKVYLVLIWFVLSCFILVFLEVILRIFYPGKQNDTKEYAAFDHNPTYLVDVKPNVQKQFIRSQNNGGDTIIWKTNSEGFRGIPLQQKKLRIMVYGDSNIQARFSPLQETYPWQLGQYLNQTNSDSIEVINAGVVGFGPDQSLLKFKEEHKTFKPDIVILQVFADNDYGDLIRNQLFDLDDLGNLIKRQHKPILDPVLEKYEARNRTFGYFRLVDIVHKIRRSIRTKEEAKLDPNRIIEICSTLSREEYAAYQGENDKVYSHFADHYDLDVATNPQTEASKKKVQLMHEILKEFHRAAQSNGIDFLVLIQPSSVDITPNSYFDFEDLQNQFSNYNPRNLSKFIRDICVLEGIDFIDLYPIFLENQAESYYFKKGNDHWTGRGQKKAAEVTSNFLLEYFKRTDSIAN